MKLTLRQITNKQTNKKQTTTIGKKDSNEKLFASNLTFSEHNFILIFFVIRAFNRIIVSTKAS